MTVSASRVTVTQLLILQELSTIRPGETMKAGPLMLTVAKRVEAMGLVQTGRGGYGHMLDRLAERGWITQTKPPIRNTYRMQGQIRVALTADGCVALLTIEAELGI